MSNRDIAITDFLVGSYSDANSEQAALLAKAIIDAIKEYKDGEEDFNNAFSVNASYENGKFTASVSFDEDLNKTIMYYKNTDNEIVRSIYSLENEKELVRLAALMLNEKWVSGYYI